MTDFSTAAVEAALEAAAYMPASEVQYSIKVTARDGSEATVTGDANAIDRIITALEKDGARWNADLEIFDFGFWRPRRM